jgi:trigger factor
VTDEDIEEELQRQQNRQASVETVERPAELGDLVQASITEKEAGSSEILSEQKDLPITLLAPDEDDDGPELGTNIVGLAAGEAKTWTYTYPDYYEDDRFAGKTVEITAEVHLVQKRELPELDDEFAGLIGDYDSLDQLKEALKDGVRRTKQYQIDQELMPKVLEQVVDQVEMVKWPAVLEEHEINHAISHREQDLSRQGLDLQSFLNTQQTTMEEFRDELRESVQNSLKTTLVLNKVIEQEKLQLEAEELRQQAELMTLLSGGNQQARQAFQSPAGLQMLANNLLYDKARERLLAIAKGETIVEEAPVAEAEDDSEVEIETAPASDDVTAETAEDMPEAAEDSTTDEEDAAENREA